MANKTVRVYSIATDGEVIERIGIISRKTDKNIIVTLYGGQRMSLPKTPCVVRKDVMWSSYPCKNVYIEQMLEILVERRESYRSRLESTSRKIANIRECAG